jgi:hypothetical protein
VFDSRAITPSSARAHRHVRSPPTQRIRLGEPRLRQRLQESLRSVERRDQAIRIVEVSMASSGDGRRSAHGSVYRIAP